MLSLLVMATPQMGFAASDTGKPGAGADTAIPFKRSEEGATAQTAVRGVVALVVVLGIGIGVLFSLRRYLPVSHGGGVGGRRIQLIETRRLTPRTALFLVTVDGERLLLAQSGDNIQHLRLGNNNGIGGDDVVSHAGQ